MPCKHNVVAEVGANKGARLRCTRCDETRSVAILKMKRGKPIVIGPIMGMFTVTYPYRKTKDLYVSIEGHPVKCCQDNCGVEFPVEDLVSHIMGHDRRKVTLVEVYGLKPELVPELPYRAESHHA